MIHPGGRGDGLQRVGVKSHRLVVKADFVLIDETLVRKVAVENNVAVKGTLGILEEAC